MKIKQKQLSDQYDQDSFFKVTSPEQVIRLKQCNLLKEINNEKTNDLIKFKSLSGMDLHFKKYIHRKRAVY